MTAPLARLALVATALAASLTLVACESAKKTLGLERQMPDEFKVVTRAPLALPPDFNLRPPEPGAPRPQDVAPRDSARAALIGQSGGGGSMTSPAAAAAADARTAGGGTTAAPLSTGEVALLQAAETDRAIPGIRTLVNRETSALTEENRSFTDRLVFWRDSDEDDYGELVDPEGELRRLRENQSLGRPVTDGRTPTIERRERGLLEGLF